MEKVIALDPGDTTGWSVWNSDDPWNLVEGGQGAAWDIIDALADSTGVVGAPAPQDDRLVALFAGWNTLVVEDWKLYPDPSQPGRLVLPAWDKCLTARYIGALNLVARRAGKRFILQGANIKSAAMKGGAESMFARPLHENRHQNDSVMHWVYYAASKGWLSG